MKTLGWILAVLCALPAYAAEVDLTGATVVARGEDRTAATVLSEEVAKRTGLQWPVNNAWPEQGAVVAIVSGDAKRLAGVEVPAGLRVEKPEAFALATDTASGRPTVWIVGADRRGALFGVGKLLRSMNARQGAAGLPEMRVKTAPAYPLRGHQLGYRATANSYDAWDIAQYDQYIRELALFGANAIETIPFQDTRPTPVMKVPRDEMERAISGICDKYGIDYWVWTPADFDLTDAQKRAEALDAHERFYASVPRLNAVFFPGGDPGDNPPELVMPFLEDVAARLAKYHDAKIWISLQGFDDHDVDVFYKWVGEHMPVWMGGVVAGPSSPPIPDTRMRLPKQYGLRHYPDITHVVRAQYPVPWIDPAFAFTLGREPVNPRPVFYSYIHNNTAPYTTGFLSYSDGVHDDLNKAVWSALAWDPKADLREVVTEYGRLFFGADAAEAAANGLFALEKNWEGALALNGSVDGTLTTWQGIEQKSPELLENWRFQMHLMRAYYDAYVRHRLIREAELEREANARLAEAGTIGADAAIDAAMAILQRADAERVRPEWRQRVVDLCEALYGSIGLQTSVEKYHAIGKERGAVLDYVDYPLNNRWWMEDEMAKAGALPTEAEKAAALLRVATWEDPGPGGYYDDIGNVAKSQHVVRGEQINTATSPEYMPVPDFMWWDNGTRRVRQSWISKMDWPLGVRYMGLDPEAEYVVRVTGNKDCFLRVNGVRLAPSVYSQELGEIKEFPVPTRLYRDGTILVTFDAPFEPGINWRQASWINEIWLMKK